MQQKKLQCIISFALKKCDRKYNLREPDFLDLLRADEFLWSNTSFLNKYEGFTLLHESALTDTHL